MRRISDDHDYNGGEEDQRFLGDPGGLGFDLGGGPTPTAPDFGMGEMLGDRSGDPGAPFGGSEPTSGGEGNTERGRDLRPDDTPTMPQPMDMGLPRGVSINDALAVQDSPEETGMGNGGATMDTPATPIAPSPVAAHTPNPAYAQVGSQAALPSPTVGTGPRRRSMVSPQIFGESKSPLLFGRAGGLLGGGLGATGGGESSGPIAPTQQMLKLLQLFQQQ